MSKIRILATEDDPLHEEMLRVTLQKLGYSLIDVVFKPTDIMLKVAATKPDLILMDIDLGGEISGIELTKEINSRYDIPVIYVTSFADSNTFREALETYPNAYVVKPYKEEELQRAIELAIFNKRDNKIQFKGWGKDVVVNKHIYVKEDGILKKVDLNEIKLVEAYDKYCFIYTGDQKIMIRSRLSDVIEGLPESIFCQVHRSYVINVNAIDSIDASDYKISIAGKEIAVTKTFKNNLFSRLHTIG
jgi:DNA-binding LytR/AlgR family response regulator